MKRKRSIGKILIVAAACLLLTALFDMLATKLVYDGLFARYDAPAKDEFVLIAAERAEYSFACGSDTLKGRLFEADPSGANGALIVVCPGMKSGYEDLTPQILRFTELGYSVFAFDPAGCRSSGGKSAKGFTQGVLDLEACLDFVEEKGLFGCSTLLLLGQSRGGFAVCLEAESGRDIAGIAAVSAPDSAMDAAVASSSKVVGSFAAYANYPMLWLYQTMLFGAEDVGRRASESVRRADIPVLVIAGADDATYGGGSASLYGRLEESAPVNARLIRIDGGHTDLMFEGEDSASAEFIDTVSAFFEECLTAAP